MKSLNTPPFGVPGSHHLIMVAEKEKTEFVFAHEILYLRGDGKSTTFHLLDWTSGTLQQRTLTTGNNLGYYEDLLGLQFIRVHQSFIINHLYLKHTLPDKSIKLRYPHEEMSITATYQAAVKEQLKQLSCPKLLA
jgi:DNA-binding LytR/AlgR family response regulator